MFPFCRLQAVVALASCCSIVSGSVIAAEVVASGSRARVTAVYDKAREALPDDLYPPYRLLDRIVSANPSVRQRVSIAIRSIDADWCQNVLGSKEFCGVASQLPDVDRGDNFLLWALQVAGAAQGNPNAYASSYNNRITLNRSLDEAFAGSLDAKACVIAHELAHIEKDHIKSSRQALAEWNRTAAVKIHSAIGNAKKAQRSSNFWTAVSVVANAASAGLNAGMGNYGLASMAEMNNRILLSNYSMESAAGNQLVMRIMNAAQKEAPEVYQALAQMQGLSARIVQRTMKDVNIYLGEVRRNAADLSRQQEYEADSMAVGYLANAGIDPSGCLEMITLLHRGNPRAVASALDTHPGETERRRNLESVIASVTPIYRQAVGRKDKPLPLAYTYDARSELVTIFPRGAAPAHGIGATTVDRFLSDPDARRRDGRARTQRQGHRIPPVATTATPAPVSALNQPSPPLPYSSQIQQIEADYRRLNEWQHRRRY